MNAVTSIHLYRHLDEMAPWNDRLQVLEVAGITDEAPDVKTFTFRSDAQTWFRYKPGQFITLELPTADGPLMRTYTLASSPSRPLSISITVKAQAGSIGTRWMFDNLKRGSRIKARGPAGDFSHHNHAAAKYLFISAGSGITPMMSMLRWLNDCAPWTDIAFVNCARRPEEIIFRKELELLGANMPGLSLGFMIEERSSRESWFGHMGRIDAVRLPLLSPDFHEREVFCCGPDPFMRAVRTMLEATGFDMAHYHQESFGAPPVEVLPPAITDAGAAQPAEATMPVRFTSSDVDGQCVPGQTVLQAARASGVRISAACEFGLCGTCRVRKVSGDVEMSHNGGILDEEIADGYILACCSKPLTALEIEA
ncbi:MAG TPA: hybrid-cluster NAD(P)-dependent oxidoreductase [Mesorhizobium sp.]|jgi:ferredoxin-NADP reductase|uniref:hybrid-cluster NAD(P)-dependent oxidoreductase n=1 Tax=Mesorhizobium sp. TaxID=1871066 RepID=UPI002DDCB1ED|nr:hybrid-cluster NAD(P)-dependent oxidoreductase [Mesorhizobium sp.]HEV2503602.1 hybrid-cluster NAD(P)-dependent oxidoreductase [Mesorhizobium sp.]